MKYKIYQVDAFAAELFQGNPAAIMPLEEWLPDDVLQQLAIENNLSETAFYVPQDDDCFQLRWFTPGFEVDLCGHATLAAAHVLFEHAGYQPRKIRFQTRVGELIVQRSPGAEQTPQDNQKPRAYQMDFPLDNLTPIPIPDFLPEALGAPVLELFAGREDWLAIVENQATLEGLNPNQHTLMKPESRGVIVSAQGDDVEFVSRCFFPKAGVPEDPVTGSAHTTMAAYWGPKLNRTAMRAKQLSARGGSLGVQINGDRVVLTGQAVTFMEGQVFLKT